MGWKEQARKDFEGEFIKFLPNESKVMTFLSEPKARKFKPKDKDKNIPSYDIEVKLYNIQDDGVVRNLMAGNLDIDSVPYETKVLSVTSKRLMNYLMEEDDIAPILNDTFMIKALGDGMQRSWIVKRLPKIRQTDLFNQDKSSVLPDTSATLKKTREDKAEAEARAKWDKDIEDLGTADKPSKKKSSLATINE